MCDPTRDHGSSPRGLVPKQKKPYFKRKWPLVDVIRALTVIIVHILCLLAPFNFEWEALRFGLVLFVLTTFSITFSYHRNLSHLSFKIPKWLEYPFAYSAVFALQGDPLDWVSIHRFHHQFTDTDRDPHSPKVEGLWFSHVLWIFDTQYIKHKCGGRDNVMDLKQQWFYRFLRRTIALHILMFWTILYLYGGLPFLTCGGGVGGVIGYHVTWLVNSACHVWGSRSWKTKDTSRNIWWLSLLTMGESWHNNHHAFESSARQGLEWWQIDLTWYLIRLLELLGVATHVKLPSDFQKQKMALSP